MNISLILVVAGAMLLADCADGGASLVRSMGLRGSQQSLPEGSNLRGGQQLQSRTSYIGSPAYNAGQNNNVVKNSHPAKSQRGLGISAWGIIGIIVGIILLTSVGYYAFVLYPFICNRQQSYDMIELTNVV